jgi:hypothetical protein
MPQAEVIFYQEGERVFLREWLNELPNEAQKKCLTFMTRLEMEGHELRRPIADFLRDGIYELRPSYQGFHYRILYFFTGKDVVVLCHGIAKENKVPGAEIDRAVRRRKRFEADPEAHSYKAGK